jgi:PAS domain S-box-containing protein
MGVAEMLEHVNVPSYVIDATGIIRWVNPAAQRIVGDVRGLQFTSVVSPEDTHRARELFARKVVGAAQVTDSNLEVVGADGGRVGLEVSSVPLFRGEHVVGVFGTGLGPGRATSCASGPAAHTTPGGGARTTRARPSTTRIAQDLHLSSETVRNHIRHILKAVGAHSRLEAVAIANGAH